MPRWQRIHPWGCQPFISKPLQSMRPVSSRRITPSNGCNGRLCKGCSIRSNDRRLLKQVTPLGHLCCNVWRSQGLNLNVVWRIFILKSLTEVLNKLLGSRIDSHERKRSITSNGWNINNESSSLGNHERKYCSSYHNCCLNVDLDMLQNAFLILIQESVGRFMHNSCIIYKDSYVSAGSFNFIRKVSVRLNKKKDETTISI